MSELQLLGSFESSMDNLQKIVRWASAPLDTERYDQIYFNVAKEELRTIGNQTDSVVAWCTFHKPFVRDVELGDDVDGDAGMEAIVKIPQLENYLNFVGGEVVTVEFYAPEDSNRATKMALHGDLSAEIYIPNSDVDYENIQHAIVEVFDENNVWRRPSNDEPLSTSFTTNVEEFEKIMQVVNFDSFALTNYPVTIEDGEFVLNASDGNERDSVSGSLYAEDVDGPDVSNVISAGFEELFNNIGGEIEVQIEDDAPMAVVRTPNDDSFTLRYTLLPAVEV